jgi:cysteine desulfurase family protein
MIYLDNASTTYPKPASVIEAVNHYMTKVGASPGRGGYCASTEAGRMVDRVRDGLTRLVNGADSNRTIFTASCTDALNMAINGVLAEGDHVITTALEHNSVSRPLQAMHNAGHITLTRIPFGESGCIDPDDIAKAITPKTKLIAVTHASNVTGVIQPVAEVGAIAREHDVLFLMDAAQTIGVVDIDMQAMLVDLLAFPAHKELLAPPGLGALCVGLRCEVLPWRQGGSGVDSISPTQPEDWPTILEAGTPNTVGIAGLHAALDEIKPAATLAYLRGLLDRLFEGVEEMEGLRVIGNLDSASRVGTVSIMLGDLSPMETSAILDESFGICVRPGLHCAPYTHRTLGTFPDGTIRVSPGPFTTEDDIDQTREAFRQILDKY